LSLVDDFTNVSKESDSTIDNPFINGNYLTSMKGVAAAQTACGPNITFNASLSTNYTFGSLIGASTTLLNNKFRITSASYSPTNITINGKNLISFDDFDTKWAASSFTAFSLNEQTTSFAEFSMEPLRKY
jgi:hypothetical protein